MTTRKGRGYSIALWQMLESRDPADVVVRFAKHCVKTNTSVIAVAEAFGVSRVMVYHWFHGRHRPCEAYLRKMAEFLQMSE